MSLLRNLFLTLVLAVSLSPSMAQDDIDELHVTLSSNYKYVLNNQDLYDIGCDQIIVFKGFVQEAFLGSYKGVKFYYNEWIILRNEVPVDTVEKPMYKNAKGWFYDDDVYFNVFPYAGVYRVQLNVRAYVTGYPEDDFIVQTGNSNLITIYDDFMPKLIGGVPSKTDNTHVFNKVNALVLDCTTASCMKEYYVVINECDANWNIQKKRVEKVYYGDTEAFIDLFTLSVKEGYRLQPEIKYIVGVGPGSNVLIDPKTWFINERFTVTVNSRGDASMDLIEKD